MKHIATYQNYKLLLESLASAKARFKDAFTDAEYLKMAEIDPTPTKKYLDKIVEWALRDEDINLLDVKMNIEIYNNLLNKNLVDIKDINQFKTYSDFYNYVEQNKNNVSKAEQAKITKEGSMVIFEDNKWLLLRIKTKDASCLYGKGTKWCITMKDQHYWENYNNDSIFYFIINKTLPDNDLWKKVAIRHYFTGENEFWNTSDNEENRKKPYKVSQFLKITKFPRKLLSLLTYAPTDYSNITPEQFFKKHSISKYTLLEDGSYDINDDVQISKLNLTKFPIKFRNVSGNFSCSHNQLTSLEGGPQEVGGNFNCSNNQLTSLEGGPQEVGGYFYCSFNQLTSLEGTPEKIRGGFSCSFNQLTSLEGTPQKVGEYFYCSNNKLTSLEGAPQEIGGDFSCSNNKLTSLEGGPQEVSGNFSCSFNQLTSLEGTPREIKSDFSCSYNQLTSLKGAPQEIGGNFSCNSNELTSLEGAPEKIEGVFNCSNNKLTSLEGGPQEVGYEYRCFRNQLTSLEGAPQKVGGGFNCSENQLTSLENAPREVGGDFDCSRNHITSLEGGPQEIGGKFICHHNAEYFPERVILKAIPSLKSSQIYA